jgi:peptide/nickel transport system substrate-binding protein
MSNQDGGDLNRAQFLKGAAAFGVGLAATAYGAPGLAKAATVRATAAAGKPRRGGTLRIGLTGGSAKDTLDGDDELQNIDAARAFQLYDGLATHNHDFTTSLALAEEITPSANATSYTIRVKPDIEFHNGKNLSAEDVAFTLRRILNPKNPFSAATFLSGVDTSSFKFLDKRTLRFDLNKPNAILLDTFAEVLTSIVPVGYNPLKPIGTGPFKLVSWQPGIRSVMVRNPNYWRSGQPYVDELIMLDFPDPTARVNALLAGQIDAFDSLPLGSIDVIKGKSDLAVLESKTGRWMPFYMRVDAAPFDDVRVRQAMRLIVGRKEIIEQALGGHGTVANDMWGQYDPCYPSGVAQRDQDIPEAKRLLAQAGHKNLSVVLNCSSDVAGMLAAAQVFAQQAQAAGVKVTVNNINPSIYYNPLGPGKGDYPFGMDTWSTRGYLTQAAYCGVPGAVLNEMHWSNPRWYALYRKAVGTVDDAARCALIKKMEQIDFESGGYINWGNPNSVDAYSTKVHGLAEDVIRPLGNYTFREVWLG